MNEIQPYLRDIIIDFQKPGKWKVQLTTLVNFISSKDAYEEHIMHSKSNNTEFMTYDNANDVVDELFDALLLRYQVGLETSMRGSYFIFRFFSIFY